MTITENQKVAAKKIATMLHGAFLLTVLAFVVWATMNFDVLVKAMRYPEAVRALQIEVKIANK